MRLVELDSNILAKSLAFKLKPEDAKEEKPKAELINTEVYVSTPDYLKD